MGAMLQGELTVTYADGSNEMVNSGDLFYWPSGHSVKVGQADLLMGIDPIANCLISRVDPFRGMNCDIGNRFQDCVIGRCTC